MPYGTATWIGLSNNIFLKKKKGKVMEGAVLEWLRDPAHGIFFILTGMVLFASAVYLENIYFKNQLQPYMFSVSLYVMMLGLAFFVSGCFGIMEYMR